MAIVNDYVTGTISLTSGSADFTSTGAALQSAGIRAGDQILLPAKGMVLVIASITGENAGTLTDNCPAGAAGAGQPMRIRFQADGSRYTAAARALVEMLSDGKVASLAALNGAADKLAYLTGATTFGLTSLTAFGRSLLASTDASGVRNLASVREVLTANRTYYVRADGNDSNDGLANTSGGAFLTIQKAVDTVATIDLAGKAVTIQVGAGTYTGAVTLKSVVGGDVTIVGDETTPSNVLVNVSGTCFLADGVRGVWSLYGMKLQATVHCISSSNNSIIKFRNIDFGTCSFWHLTGNGGSLVATGGYKISGSAQNHIRLFGGASITAQTVTVTLTGTPAFTRFVDISQLSIGILSGITYSGAATGIRYSATLNGAIITSGGGANYFPGDSAGSTATGGQYA